MRGASLWLAAAAGFGPEPTVSANSASVAGASHGARDILIPVCAIDSLPKRLYGRRAFEDSWTSNVTEAHRLSQSARTSGGAGIMCTALISQRPARPSRNLARPSESERAASLLSGSSLLNAITRASGRGL